MTSAHDPYCKPPDGVYTLDHFTGLQDGPKPSGGRKKKPKGRKSERWIFMRWDVDKRALVDHEGNPFTDAVLDNAVAYNDLGLIIPPNKPLPICPSVVMERYTFKPRPGCRVDNTVELATFTGGTHWISCTCQAAGNIIKGISQAKLCSHMLGLFFYKGMFPIRKYHVYVVEDVDRAEIRRLAGETKYRQRGREPGSLRRVGEPRRLRT